MEEARIIDFLNYLRFEKRFSPHTLTSYQQDLSQFAAFLVQTFGTLPCKNIETFHLRSWLASLKDEANKPRTINRKMAALSSFFKFLMQQQVVSKNPVEALHNLRTEERLPEFLKENEAEFLLETIDFPEGFQGKTERLICEMLYQTGMRRNELLQLKDNNVEWSLRQLRVLGKGNKERLIPMSAEMLASIKEYQEAKKFLGFIETDALLVLKNGKPLYAGYIYTTVKKYLTKVTTLKKKSPHILRHSFATHLLNHGANIQAIKDLLGHSSLAATQIYTHTNIEKLKEIHKLNHPRG